MHFFCKSTGPEFGPQFIGALFCKAPVPQFGPQQRVTKNRELQFPFQLRVAKSD